MFYLYILYSKSINHYYIGQTSDLDGRLRRHISSSTCSNWTVLFLFFLWNLLSEYFSYRSSILFALNILCALLILSGARPKLTCRNKQKPSQYQNLVVGQSRTIVTTFLSFWPSALLIHSIHMSPPGLPCYLLNDSTHISPRGLVLKSNLNGWKKGRH